MIVLKFGGTSVGSVERLINLPKLITRKDKTIVVMSAMSGITNLLVSVVSHTSNDDISKAKEILKEIESKFIYTATELFSEEDNKIASEKINERIEIINTEINSDNFEEKIILAQGELITTEMFSFYLKTIGINNQLLMATDFMVLDENNEPDEKQISSLLNSTMSVSENLFITQGFIAKNINGEIDNLNRGGSDYSASLIGAATDAKSIEIWTDIDGFHNNDPRYVENTKPIEYLSFDEAAELAYFGAKILHPTSVIPARKKSIPVLLKNTMQPNAFGTLISNNYLSPGIKAVAAKDGITTIRIQSGRMLQSHGFLKRVFEVFDKYKTPIDVITTSEVAVSLTIDNTKNLHEIAEELMDFGRVKVRNNCSIVSIVGHQITSTPRSITKIYESFEHIPTHMISFGGSSNNITFVIDAENKTLALQTLNTQLFTNFTYV